MTEQSDKHENEQDEQSRLKSCTLCGKEISPYSPFCRNCGHPQGSPLALWLLGGFLALLIIIYLAMVIFCGCNVHKLRVFEEPHREQQPKDTGMITPQKNLFRKS